MRAMSACGSIKFVNQHNDNARRREKFFQSKFAGQWWGEAPDEPALARQREATTVELAVNKIGEDNLFIHLLHGFVAGFFEDWTFWTQLDGTIEIGQRAV